VNHFRIIGTLDVFPVLPRLFALQPATWPPVEARGEINSDLFGRGASLLLRGHDKITKENWLDDLPVKERHELTGKGQKPFEKPWDSMRRLLTQAKKAVLEEQERMLTQGLLRRTYLSGAMGRAMVSRLDAGSTIFWHDDDGPYHDQHARFHLPLVTNIGCFLHAQYESLHLEAGVLCWFNNRVRHCATNWGSQYRLHLIFEMRKQDAPKDDE
jgi:hypothetical protein